VPPPPPGGLDASKALALAQPYARKSSTDPIHLIGEKAGLLNTLFPAAKADRADRWVWDIQFKGTFPDLGDGYLYRAASVVLDYRTGGLVMIVPADLAA